MFIIRDERTADTAVLALHYLYESKSLRPALARALRSGDFNKFARLARTFKHSSWSDKLARDLYEVMREQYVDWCGVEEPADDFKLGGCKEWTYRAVMGEMYLKYVPAWLEEP